ncbi:hypothetical protein HELRODRAFT_193603 [Helobdella robusta]|uniref:Peptidase metallopeptidase domain-containing protein n=1 Tax=Helobdella robusta TaxID=6412 RepID=T1FV61_HELRO|nr:hypothetical protein HELRODRAFT_193603 [Helobdella robusta]ESN95251.1 hypothetical protein HELRODRAFT_193603 [Helobdella robusta]
MYLSELLLVAVLVSGYAGNLLATSSRESDLSEGLDVSDRGEENFREDREVLESNLPKSEEPEFKRELLDALTESSLSRQKNFVPDRTKYKNPPPFFPHGLKKRHHHKWIWMTKKDTMDSEPNLPTDNKKRHHHKWIWMTKKDTMDSEPNIPTDNQKRHHHKWIWMTKKDTMDSEPNIPTDNQKRHHHKWIWMTKKDTMDSEPNLPTANKKRHHHKWIWMTKKDTLENNVGDSEITKRDNAVYPTEFLQRFGYLPEPEPGVAYDSETKTNAIKEFQNMYHLEETGKLNDETIHAMTIPRCGIPDIISDEESDDEKRGIAKRFDASAYKWKKNQLKWKLQNFWYADRMPESIQRRAITDAFALWSQAVPLDFQETTGKADLNLKFVNGNHGDGPGNAFDGPNGVLAHAFFPENGELHYDAREDWTDGVNKGINLKIVTAHELGHAIGLGHSNVQGALMAPYYAGYEKNFKLRDDDIRGAQTLYGTRNNRKSFKVNKGVWWVPGPRFGRSNDYEEDEE